MAISFIRETGVLFIRNVPKAVRDNFKAACARRDESMRRTIIRFMKQYAKDDLSLKVERSHVVTGKPKGKKKKK